MQRTSVWIVRSEERDAPEVVLGVLASERDAAALVARVAADFPDGSLVYGEYPVGWTFDGGARRHGGA
ncbi:hypothetical protein [Motilibacter peucedani]|nr:hypothetical protein [Motilibacter peucedani]